MDPWGPQSIADIKREFEDNFVKDQEYNKELPDSREYLSSLERRLRSLHSKSTLIEELSAYRVDCIERLLRESSSLDPPNPQEDKYPLIKKE